MMVPALTFSPGNPESGSIEQVEPPGPADGMLVEVLGVGVCGTDRELLAAEHGSPPPGRDRMVIGHEMVGRVTEEAAQFSVGDLVAGIVRRPDPVPCGECAAGNWDMCSNGRFTERGIRQLDGFLAGTVRLEPDYAVPVPEALGDLGVLVEPASIVAKAWEQIDLLASRFVTPRRRVLVTGAGPIGLLAALLGIQRGLEIDVLDRATSGPKPDLVSRLGAAYHVGDVTGLAEGADVVVECTGDAALVFDILTDTRRNATVCLTGVTPLGPRLPVPAGEILRDLVLENDVVFGTVNANRRHYQTAVEALAAADREWLEGLITRRLPLDRWRDGVESAADDVKVVLVP